MQKEYHFYVYILTNYPKNVFYVGFTNDILRRIIEHKNGFGCKFTAKYQLKYLIYFEQSNNVYSVLEREKAIKKWSRKKKTELIKSINPGLNDLSVGLFKDLGIGETEIQGIVEELKAKYRGQ